MKTDYFSGYSQEEIDKNVDWKQPKTVVSKVQIPSLEACEGNRRVNLEVDGYRVLNFNNQKHGPVFISEKYKKFELKLKKISCDTKEN